MTVDYRQAANRASRDGVTLVDPALAAATLTAQPTVRIASVPASHPYVRAVTAHPRIAVLTDPRPVGAGEGVWWPPVILDPAWIRRNRDDADLLHLHFGTESFTPGHLVRTLDAAAEVGWPVVFTVHELEHPQLSDQRPYRDQLDILIARADALVTLTEAAADTIESTWGRRPAVFPHPCLLAGSPVTSESRAEGTRVGMHLKDIRPGVDAVGATRRLIGAVRALQDAGAGAVEAVIGMHRSVRDTDARDAVRALASHEPQVTLVEHDRLGDDELARELGGLDACVLPYRTGSHSGWLELCWDLGVPVAFPAIGFFADQHPGASTAAFEPDDDGSSLAAALSTLLSAGATSKAGTPERRSLILDRRVQREHTDRRTALHYLRLYETLLERRR